jgi:hypothetical protein
VCNNILRIIRAVTQVCIGQVFAGRGIEIPTADTTDAAAAAPLKLDNVAAIKI